MSRPVVREDPLSSDTDSSLSDDKEEVRSWSKRPFAWWSWWQAPRRPVHTLWRRLRLEENQALSCELRFGLQCPNDHVFPQRCRQLPHFWIGWWYRTI